MAESHPRWLATPGDAGIVFSPVQAGGETIPAQAGMPMGWTT
jgi:hypothetical protein